MKNQVSLFVSGTLNLLTLIGHRRSHNADIYKQLCCYFHKFNLLVPLITCFLYTKPLTALI